MIVAPGTGYGETQKGLGRHVDLIVDYVITLQRKVFLGESFFAERQEPGGHDAAIADAGIRVGRQDVAG